MTGCGTDGASNVNHSRLPHAPNTGRGAGAMAGGTRAQRYMNARQLLSSRAELDAERREALRFRSRQRHGPAVSEKGLDYDDDYLTFITAPLPSTFPQ